MRTVREDFGAIEVQLRRRLNRLHGVHIFDLEFRLFLGKK
jgi:hypothetical protein